MRADIEVIALQSQVHGGFKLSRFFVANIQHTGHFVAILCRKATGGKIHPFGHSRINKAEPLLLCGTNEQRTGYFHSVHVDHVFVVTTATHAVLAT